jgi:predicted ArsR family transcriptional regulator
VGPLRLDILKALGDNTRYAIYLELARSPLPRSTAEVAEALGLHVNTVRPHLERMRDVGLLAVDTEARGGVGRPQHRYALAPDAPTLGLEPPPWPTLATVLVRAAGLAGLDPQDVAEAAAGQGGEEAARSGAARAGRGDASASLAALVRDQQRLGFDPEVATDEVGTTVAFAHCPYRALAEADPQVVCAAHCGMVTGFVDAVGAHRVTRFHSLVDRSPCRVELARVAGGGDTLCNAPPQEERS